MLVLEQRLSARHARRGVALRARLLTSVEARGLRMKFSLLRADVEVEADTYDAYLEVARRLQSANVHVRPARRRTAGLIVAPKSSGSPVMTKPVQPQPAILASPNQMKPLYCQDTSDMKVSSPPSHSPGAILPDLPQEAAPEVDKSSGLSKDASSSETQAWLARHRFQPHASTFANFSGADLLRLSRDDIIQICGLADGIRLFNALHAKRISPRLTVYVCAGGCDIYSAVYLHSLTARGLADKLRRLLPPNVKECDTVLVAGPHGARVRLTDELVRHLPDNSTYRVHCGEDCLLLTPSHN
ncbi:hypothetical protein JYU34_000982 [Plutella xylostella]|uniref:Transcription factor CP2 n=1 Tax=Plutella xylostella TaxID=51655 RepID=A0ABQ7R5Z1_PLUXY|nr:hypothetical protein JYU34_000982 [Plutella xylostella]